MNGALTVTVENAENLQEAMLQAIGTAKTFYGDVDLSVVMDSAEEGTIRRGTGTVQYPVEIVPSGRFNVTFYVREAVPGDVDD